MPKVKDLIAMANSQFDDVYENARYYQWFQEMLDDISKDYFLPKRAPLTKGVDGAYTLPTGFKSVISLHGDNSVLGRVGIGALNSLGYYIMADKLYIAGINPTTVTLFYDSAPDKLTQSPDYIPTIPERYHPMFVSFACKQAALMEDEVAYEERYRAYHTEYEKMKKQLIDESHRERSAAVLNNATRWKVER